MLTLCIGQIFIFISTLRNILDLLGSICKTKTGAKKSVHLGVLPLMLSMYQESLRYDHRNRNAAMRRSILLVIKACVVFSKLFLYHPLKFLKFNSSLSANFFFRQGILLGDDNK